MADTRIHPTTADKMPPSSSPPTSGDNPTPPKQPPESQPVLPRATYVVQVPRDQILRYPPAENARKLESLLRRKNRPTFCRRCCCCFFCLLLLLVVAAAVAAGVLYFVFRFKSLKYDVTNLIINGVNLTSTDSWSPEFDVTIRADNPNGKIGIYYLGSDSEIEVLYKQVKLSEGLMPAFYQPPRNITVIETALRGYGVVFGSELTAELRDEQRQGRVPLEVRIKAPLKVRVGSVKTWEIRVKVRCSIAVDRLDRRADIVSRDCGYSVRLW